MERQRRKRRKNLERRILREHVSLRRLNDQQTAGRRMPGSMSGKKG